MKAHASLVSFMLAALLAVAAPARSQPADPFKLPNWKGQWVRVGGAQFDPAKPPGRGQQPPLTAEYQAVWEAHLADGTSGGQSYNPQAHCLPGGMPRMMIAYEPMEIIVTPDATYIPVALNNEFRRIYTDGRDWPAFIEPSYSGYSIGRWIDEDGDGRYDVLEIETRGFKGPRTLDPTGIPLHIDNQTVIRERLFLDRANPDLLRNEITTIDHALTRPWPVTRSYSRDHNPVWVEYACGEDNTYVFIGKDSYTVSADGLLMPLKKNQAPPDLRYFSKARD